MLKTAALDLRSAVGVCAKHESCVNVSAFSSCLAGENNVSGYGSLGRGGFNVNELILGVHTANTAGVVAAVGNGLDLN